MTRAELVALLGRMQDVRSDVGGVDEYDDGEIERALGEAAEVLREARAELVRVHKAPGGLLHERGA